MNASSELCFLGTKFVLCLVVIICFSDLASYNRSRGIDTVKLILRLCPSHAWGDMGGHGNDFKVVLEVLLIYVEKGGSAVCKYVCIYIYIYIYMLPINDRGGH